MLEFFRGWRRKVGCVTLVMACVLMGLWMRSRVIGDRVDIGGYAVVSQFGSVSIGSQLGASHRWLPMFGSLTLNAAVIVTLPNGKIATFQGWQYEHRGREMPYLYFIISLTLLSAYLILIPSRKRPSASQIHA